MTFEEIWEMERGFWLEGPDFHAAHMAAGAVMVFPAPAGILAGPAILAGLREGPRWREVAFSERTEAALGGAAVLAYRATGAREGAGPYRALCSSTYVRAEGAWRLLCHQQTPAPG